MIFLKQSQLLFYNLFIKFSLSLQDALVIQLKHFLEVPAFPVLLSSLLIHQNHIVEGHRLGRVPLNQLRQRAPPI